MLGGYVRRAHGAVGAVGGWPLVGVERVDVVADVAALRGDERARGQLAHQRKHLVVEERVVVCKVARAEVAPDPVAEDAVEPKAINLKNDGAAFFLTL